MGSPCSENKDGCPMLIHDYFPFLSVSSFPISVLFFPLAHPTYLVARKPVSVVACPFVASYLWTSTFARCVVMVITVSLCFLMLFGIFFIALSLLWQTKMHSALLMMKQISKGKVNMYV